MKLTVDTEDNTIRIESSRVHLSELMQTLNNLFPNNSWMEYELIVGEGEKVNIQDIPSMPYHPNNIWQPPVIHPYIHHTDPNHAPPFVITCSAK